MINWLLAFLGGWYILRGESRDSAAFLNLCMRRCAPYWHDRRDETGFSCRMRRRIWQELATEAAGVAVEREGGLPCILRRYRGRWGLGIGLALAAVIVWLSGQYVWRVEVRGNARYSAHDVRTELAAQGFGVGSYIPDVEINALQNRVLIASDRFSWISVNLLGTTAKVDVVELVERTSTRRETAPANLVAAADGQIARLELRDGVATVEVGEIVRAGQLLASGIVDTEKAGTRLLRAEGKVYATVAHAIRVEIPYATTVRQYTGEKKTDRRIIFFGKTINLFKNTGIVGGSCDIIDNERILSLFGRVKLPIRYAATTCLPYVEQPATRDADAARTLAEFTLRRRVDALSADREPVRMTTATTATEDAYIIDCTIWCIEDIAAVAPITLSNPTEASIP